MILLINTNSEGCNFQRRQPRDLRASIVNIFSKGFLVGIDVIYGT